MSPPPAFGTYRVLHQIGSGVLGPVFRAYDSHQDRLVAIKTFKLDLVPEDAARLALGLKALVARPLAHAGIIRGVEAGLDGATPYMALDYAGGDSMDVTIRQTGASTALAVLPVLREVARAIDASWSEGIGHGGLHPRDILVSTDPPAVIVTGLGIAQALEAVGRRAPVRRPYSAPERSTGSPWDVRADTYSLAVIAYEMLSGHRPVGLDDNEEGIGRELPADAQAALRRVLAAARAEAPGDRYGSASAFVEAFAAAAGAPSEAGESVVMPAPDSSAAASRVDENSSAKVPGPSSPQPADSSPSPQIATPPAKRVSAVPTIESNQAAAAKVRRASSSVFHKPMELGTAPVVQNDMLAFAPEPEPAKFPWAAIVAVLAAGLVLGAVAGYQLGFSRATQSVPQVTQTASGTNVVVTPPDVTPVPDPAPASPPSAAPVVTPVAKPAPPASTGRLVIQSVPSGALVLMDGQRAGETPLNMSAPVGRHELQIARSGYLPKTQTVEVTARTPQTVSVQLQAGRTSVPGTATRSATTGTVDIESRPRKAQITLDGRMVGETPLRVPELSPGDHVVEIALAGYKSVTRSVHIVSGELTRFAVTLEQAGFPVPVNVRGHR